MMVTSSSVDSNSAQEESQLEAFREQLAVEKPQAPQEHHSPRPAACEDEYDLMENKTIEQNERVNHKLISLLRQHAESKQAVHSKNASSALHPSNAAESRRMDTSGLDLDIYSPGNGVDPIHVPSNKEAKAMENIQAVSHQEEDLSQTATLEESSEEDEQEQNDEIKDLLDMEQANQYEAGFQSHRHFLGRETGLKPQLMSD